MISKKIFIADGSTIRFLSDFIIRSEQYARPYVYIYDNTKNPNGSEDVLQDGTTNQANWSFPDNIWVRGTDFPSSADIVPTDKWKVVDNGILFYSEPTANTTLYLEVASTVEEFGDTLFYYSERAAQLKAWEAEAEKMTADSYATEPLNTFVKEYTSNADGTFSSTTTNEYSSLHWASKAETSASNTFKWKDSFTATGGQTDFVSIYPVGGADVYVNGVLLTVTTDYTTSGNTVTLLTGTEVGDIVTVIGGDLATAMPEGDVGLVDTIADLLVYDPTATDTVIVKDENQGGTFVYDATLSATNNGGTIFNGWVRQYSGAVNVKWFGAVGDGVTDDSTAIQSALDLVETNGGSVLLPESSSQYNIGTTTLLIPSRVEFYSNVVPNILGGKTQLLYSGTGTAIGLKDGENDLPQRGGEIRNIGVTLSTASATGFRLWRVRDVTLRNCAVDMNADSQIGFHLKGEQDGGTYMGVFDCLLERCISYCGSTRTNAVHYKLTGVLNTGQVNATTFLMCRGGGAGAFVEVGPSDGNTFVGMEAEAITGDLYSFGDYAYNNKVYGGYAEAQSGWTGNCMTTTALSSRNSVDMGTVGINMSPSDLNITAGNVFKWAGNRVYTDASTSISQSDRVQGESFSRFERRPDGFYFGDGTATPVKHFGLSSLTTQQQDFTSAGGTITIDCDNGNNQYLRFLTGASGTFTISAMTNINDGESGTFHLINTSGVTITLSWNSNYIKNTEFPTTLTNGQRCTFSVLKSGTVVIMVGTKFLG